MKFDVRRWFESTEQVYDTEVDGPITDAHLYEYRTPIWPYSRRLNVGCGTHYADGWVNTDPMENADTKPDVRTREFPFPDRWFDRIYLGHVMEHIDWWALPAWLAGVRRILEHDGIVLATGPDYKRTLARWRDGLEPDWLVDSVLEHRDRESPEWPGSAHQWNCHEARMWGALEAAGFECSLIAPDAEFGDGWDGWPVVNWSEWQCAILAWKAQPTER